ncbi:MAG: tRNA (cytidine(34)-2'-O)-methyltransferase [Alphaproteobacteria bacterium]|nr:MAG: tRNA (cytidine(34)-2'-O)-methyltransferase [Alphaproteobacteria bacterium]
MRLALYQPDIPQNTGALMRLCACFGVGLDIIEPCGFPFSDSKLRRAGMDYIDLAAVTRHASFSNFMNAKTGRLVLVETDGKTPYQKFTFAPYDVLIVGRESAGTPREVYDAADESIFIPQSQGRSLNVALAAAITLSEALRQTGQLPEMGQTLLASG